MPAGCRSWYLDRLGNNTTVWPGSTLSYWWRTRRVDPDDFAPVTATPSVADQPEPEPAIHR